MAAAEEDRRDEPRGQREPVGEESVEQHREHRVIRGDAGEREHTGEPGFHEAEATGVIGIIASALPATYASSTSTGSTWEPTASRLTYNARKSNSWLPSAAGTARFHDSASALRTKSRDSTNWSAQAR